jgi:hypothetical protein
MNTTFRLTNVRAITAFLLAWALATGGEARADLESGLVAFYPLNGDVNDLSGHGNHAINSVNIQYVAAGASLAASFDGSTSFIEVGESPSLMLAGPMTIAAWVKPEQVDGLQCLVDKDLDFVGYNLYLDGEGAHMRICGSALTAGTVPVREWSWVAGVYSGSNIRVYTNGVLAGETEAGALANREKNLYLGMWGPAGGRYYRGLMKDVRIYNRALLPTELQDLSGHVLRQIYLIKAVRPGFTNLSAGSTYQLQISTDLTAWTDEGAAFTATNATMAYPRYWEVEQWDKFFFRLR